MSRQTEGSDLVCLASSWPVSATSENAVGRIEEHGVKKLFELQAE